MDSWAVEALLRAENTPHALHKTLARAAGIRSEWWIGSSRVDRRFWAS